jgi:protein arginine N-methyltransferase 1
MFRPSGYAILDYGAMIECEPRMPIYEEALRRAVTPGCTVIDLGAAFGVFALLACKFGAGRVIAIEPDPSIELLGPLAQANGFSDRITIIRGLSTDFTPEQKADVVVSDCRGTVSLYEHHIATLADARARLLAPGGVLLPMRDTLRIALANWPKARKERQRPWLENRYGLDLSAGHSYAVNSDSKAYLKPEALVSAPVDLAVLDYRTITEPNLDAAVELVATRTDIVDGLLIWFDAEIAEGLGYSNAPGEPELVYGQMFLPLAEPVTIEAGGVIAARIRANLIDNDYIWSWSWQVSRGNAAGLGPVTNQSTFLRQIHSPKQLARGSSSRVPEPGVKLTMARECLKLVGDGRSYGDIARIMSQTFPEELPDTKSALDFTVAALRAVDQ